MSNKAEDLAKKIISQEIALKINKMKQKEENKRCFDCGEKGTNYICTNFGTFICSRCAGILRELNFKVKGIGVTIFNEREMDILEKNGNAKAKKIWLGKYKKGKDKAPSVIDDNELKDFLKEKYEDKRWYKKPKKKKEDDDDEEEEDKKKNKKKKKDESDDEDDDKDESDSEEKKKKNDKKKKNKKKKNDSDDEEDNDDEDDSDEDNKKKNDKNKNKKKRGIFF